MSLIFKALQRVEEEQAGRSEVRSSSATEILKRAEQQTRVERHTASSPAHFGISHSAEHGIENRTQAPMESTRFSSRVDPVPSAPEGTLLDQCKTLKLPFPFNDRLVPLANKESPAAEAFRLLGVRLRHLRRERVIKKLLICSTTTQEGKSMISTNLACTLAAASKQNVLLVEGDIRRPSIGNLLRIDPYPGLCECLRGERSLLESIYRIEDAGLWFMPAGSPADNQTDLIQVAELPNILEQLSSSFQWIIIDSPPLLPLADTSIWARLADSILLVARNGTTEKKKLEKGIEALDMSKVLGAVINSSKSSAEEDYYYYRRSNSEFGEIPRGD